MTVVPVPYMRDEIIRLGYADDPLSERDEWRWKFLALLWAHLCFDLEQRSN